MTQKIALLTIKSQKPSGKAQNCAVVPNEPLWIQELLLSPFSALGAPKGQVPPGTQPTGSLRNIAVDSSNPVFTTAAPFTLSVTYDDESHFVSDVSVS